MRPRHNVLHRPSPSYAVIASMAVCISAAVPAQINALPLDLVSDKVEAASSHGSAAALRALRHITAPLSRVVFTPATDCRRTGGVWNGSACVTDIGRELECRKMGGAWTGVHCAIAEKRCATGYTGVYPNCHLDVPKAAPLPRKDCPIGSSGIWPNCDDHASRCRAGRDCQQRPIIQPPTVHGPSANPNFLTPLQAPDSSRVHRDYPGSARQNGAASSKSNEPHMPTGPAR